ncbi:A24 family peptidase [Sphingomonas rubra]|nr:prepilin peptidase [Sphingomonas rubra]
MDGEILRAALALTLGGLLVSAGIEDARTREIADGKSIAIALAAPLWWWANGISWWPGVPVQLLIGAGTFAVFALAFHVGMMGGGDVKLLAALSLWLPLGGWASMLVAMSLAGGVVTAAMLVERRWKGGEVEVPYGVAIAIAGLLALREPVLNQFA